MPKRRANGEGNIRKRKDGRWEGRYTVGHDPETGKAIIKNVLSKTQAGDSVKGELIYNQARKSGQKAVRTFLISHKSCGRIVYRFVVSFERKKRAADHHLRRQLWLLISRKNTRSSICRRTSRRS